MKDDKYYYKILFIFTFFLFFIIIFIFRIFYIQNIKKPEYVYSPIHIQKELALRGNIVSSENFTLAKSQRMYSVAVIPKYIDKSKLPLFKSLLSIYTNKPINYFDKLLQKRNRVILLRHLPFNIKKNLDYLNTVLNLKKVFEPNDYGIIFGLEIIEESSNRIYKLKDRFEPILGYVREKNGKVKGINGIEKYYDEILQPKQDGLLKMTRDVKGRVILDDTFEILKYKKDGAKLTLNINILFQGKVEKLLDKYKKELKAKEIIAIVMESNTGKIRAIASSNRYNPMKIRQKDIPYLKVSHIQYTYEPGSVMKPITLAILLENQKVNIYEVLNAHNGVFYFKPRFTIYDDEKFKWLNVINAVIHSSNIVFAQLGLRLTPIEFRSGLLKFGFNQKTGIDLPYEYNGRLFSTYGFESEIHRASNSFGYAMQATLIQLVNAYNVFNNNGIMITPKIAYSYANTELLHKKTRILSAANAQLVLNILRQVVLKGTAKATNIEGLFIAGKTGTAKINKNGKYIKGLYNSSFIGFVNDNKHKYTIGVLVVKPDKKRFFASQTAVVVFKNIVQTMLELNLLKKISN